LIQLSDANPVPQSVEGGDEGCFLCGHCVAACPREALSHKYAAPAQCLPIRDDLRIGIEQVGQLLRSRRSIRNYEDRAVPRETIRELLDIARFAPSGCNSQPVHWLVVHDTTQVRQIAARVVDGLRNMLEQTPGLAIRDVLARLVQAWDDGVDVVSRGAPHLVMAHGPQANPLAQSAGIIAQTYFELAASASGLGTCWMGLIDMTANTWPPLQKLLGLPQGHIVLGTLALGYPRFKYSRIPPRCELRVAWR
jgi:nitroreductase